MQEPLDTRANVQLRAESKLPAAPDTKNGCRLDISGHSDLPKGFQEHVPAILELEYE